jgi:hypothetical protein
VEYCVLIANPASYDGKEIRLTGTYVVIGNSDSYFFSSSCEGKMLWVEFTTGYESRSDVKALRALAEMRKKSGFRWVRPHVSVITGVSAKAEVRLVGRFRASNPYAQEVKDMGSLGQFTTPRARYDFVLEVLSAEKVRRLTN